MFFFFNDTATTEIYTLSLHDALPILPNVPILFEHEQEQEVALLFVTGDRGLAGAFNSQIIRADRKSTRLNSSHSQISYAVLCLKKKKCTLAHRVKVPQRRPHLASRPR